MAEKRVCEPHTQAMASPAEMASAADHAGPNVLPEYAQTLAREIAHRQDVEGALRDSLHELRQREEALRQSEEQLRDFMENATEPLHRVGADGTILWANRAELEMLGYAREDYVGCPITQFHVDPEAIADILARLGRGEALREYPARLRARDGSIKHVVVASSACFRDGKFLYSRCFTRDVTDQHNVEAALHQSERQLQSVTDALPALVSFVDDQWTYRFVSAAYQRWFGRPKSELVGRSVEDVIGPAAFEVVRPHMQRALAGHLVTFEAEVPYRDGGTRSVAATYAPQFAEDGRVSGFVALIGDVSERSNFERFRAVVAARAERLVRITAAIAGSITADEVLEAVVDHVARAVDASSAALWLIDEDSHTARLARSVGYADAAKQALARLPLDLEPSLPVLDAVRHGAPVWIPSRGALLAHYPQLGAVVSRDRAYRACALPLVSQGRTLGALAITIEEERDPDDEERDFLLLVARYAGQAIERLRLLDAERRSRERADAAAARLTVLSRATRTFVDADLDLTPRLGEITRELADVLDSCVGIALLEADQLLHTTAVHHPVPEAGEMLASLAVVAPLALGEGVTGTVALTGRGALIPATDPAAVSSVAAASYRSFLERFPVYAMLCAPLLVRGKVIGTVTATRTRAGETYRPDDLALLEALAGRAAPAIENSRLHRENLAARARAEQLYHFAKVVESAERVENVFEAALDAIEGALGTNRGAILIFDDREVMRFRAWRRLSEDYRRQVEGHSPWAADATAPQPVLIPDVESDAAWEGYRPLFRQEGIRSLAFIPLVTRGRLIGKFMVYYDRPHTYSRTEIELATAIANQLASVTARFAAITKLEETVRYNELFAGVLAHDLRNPLSAMMTAAQLVLMRREGEGEREDDSTTKPLSRIISSGQRMTRMIEQLLDLTRARVGGGIEVERSEVNLAELCDQAVGEIEVTHPSWTIRREAMGDLHGSWDGDRIMQIISNLVSNAGQHGKGNSGISITLDGRPSDAVTVEVHNAGVVAETVLPHLFDPFRGTRHHGEYSRGLGLGLFIVKELARAHGGTVDVTSTEEAGTTFRVRLARRAAAPVPGALA